VQVGSFIRGLCFWVWEIGGLEDDGGKLIEMKRRRKKEKELLMYFQQRAALRAHLGSLRLRGGNGDNLKQEGFGGGGVGKTSTQWGTFNGLKM